MCPNDGFVVIRNSQVCAFALLGSATLCCALQLFYSWFVVRLESRLLVDRKPASSMQSFEVSPCPCPCPCPRFLAFAFLRFAEFLHLPLSDHDQYLAAKCMNRLARLSARWITNRGSTLTRLALPCGDCSFCFLSLRLFHWN